MRPEREQQALREAGRTDVSRAVTGLLVALFLTTIAIVPLLEPVLSDASGVAEVGLGVAPAVQTARREGLLAANRALLAGINRFEDSVEEESFLRSRVLPVTQHLLRPLGVGNEQVYLGREGWLFLRADFDHVTGPGFLEPRVLRKDRGSRAADPLPAILALDQALAGRGIELVVMPTPVKPTIHPEFATLRAGKDALIHNFSFYEFLDRLEAAGIGVFDPSTAFAAAKVRGGPLYLATDTHWTARAMALAARELASLIESLVEFDRSTEQFVRREVSVAGQGDLARLLRHSDTEEAWTSERTKVSRVTTRQGRPWRPDRNSEVLLLGDSFTNVYSEAGLGWGTGAGLAEQLSFELDRSVDRIAINAGGAWSSRQALARAETSGGQDRLTGKRIVIYQFAARELSSGDWKVLDVGAKPGSN